MIASCLMLSGCSQGENSSFKVTEEEGQVTIVEGLKNTVQLSDVVVVDFVGKIDGEAFNGGTANNQQVLVGGGQYIDGFEEGMLGMKVGETKDVVCTFPTTYKNNPALAGKEAVFTITVHKIYRMVEVK